MSCFISFKNRKHKHFNELALFTSTFLLLPNISNALPERPAIDRDVHMTEGREYTRPTIPPVQTSADGRVSLSHKSQDGGGTFLRLQVPEKMQESFVDSGDGVTIFAQENALADRSSQIRPLVRSAHVGLCDPSGDPNSIVKNPQNCGGDDCYELVVISSEVRNRRRRILGTPITVRVENPKTPDARISSVEVDERNIRRSRFFPTGEFREFFEPVTVGDGRLLVVRQSSSSFVRWQDSTGRNRRTRADSIYFVNDNPDDFEACDVTQWDKAHPLTHAPYDTTINRRYGFAMMPFRDPEGRLIDEGADVGTYPWIDKGADVLTVTTVGKFLSDSEYESECVTSRCDSTRNSEEGGHRNGRVMMGLWTLGKMVLMDNLVNNIDFVQRAPDSAHRNVRLYDGNNQQAFVRVGNGRDGRPDELPPGSSGSTSFFDSNEHRFNFMPSMVPVTPADVSWIVSSGRGTDELPFDDFVNPNSFINSSMVQVQRFRPSRSTPELWGDVYVEDAVQNAATTTTWNVPENGQLFGDIRIEPVAMGGVKGKGLWLDGDDDGIRYEISDQSSNILNNDWYYSLFVDRRNGGERDQVIMSFPDGSSIRLGRNRYIQFLDSRGREIHSITSPARFNPGSWVHLGFQLSNSNRTIDTYVNGYLADSYDSSGALFQLSPGELTVGASPNSNQDFKGWIDEFKVFAENVNPEVACNHALGTVVGVRNNAPTAWSNKANAYPNSSHRRITNLLRDSGESTFRRYTCYADYSDDYAAHLGNIPNGLESVRDAINFPEGPIVHSEPRPDSSENAFCLSCHVAGAPAGLGLDALELRPRVLARDDERRQPMQPDPRVFGNIPAGWINSEPARSFVADPREGYQIDRLLLRE